MKISRVLLIDDQEIVARALQKMVEHEPDIDFAPTQRTTQRTLMVDRRAEVVPADADGLPD